MTGPYREATYTERAERVYCAGCRWVSSRSGGGYVRCLNPSRASVVHHPQYREVAHPCCNSVNADNDCEHRVPWWRFWR